MGLDMYFEGTFSTRAFTERSFDKTKVALDPSFESLLESIGFEDAPKEFTNWNYYSVNIPIAYWRKVNCIHNWFVENVQGGNDNCDRHYVSDEQIKELVEEIDNILSESDPKTKLAKAEANVNYATSQQALNKEQSALNKDLGEGIKMLGDNLAEVIKFLQKIGGNN